jgi:hypothetical protein
MAEKHRLALHEALRAEGHLHNQAKAPENPQKVISSSVTDMLDDPQWAENPADAVSARLRELEQALAAGRLQPSDAKTLVTCLSMGMAPPADLLARVSSALSEQAS